MRNPSIGRRPRLVIAAGLLALALAAPSAVSADTTGAPSIPPAISHDATIQVTSVSVTAKVIATVSLSFTCQPLQSYDWETGQTIETTVGRVEGGGATIIQAQGRTLDWGTGEVFGGSAVCDGTTVNTASTPVTAAVSPWKNGAAVVGAYISVCDEQCSDSDYATSGPISVKLSNH